MTSDTHTIAAAIRRTWHSDCEDCESSAAEWVALNFTPREAIGWMDAGAFDPNAAHALRAAGVTPAMGARMIDICGYTASIAYAVSNGDLTMNAAINHALDA